MNETRNKLLTLSVVVVCVIAAAQVGANVPLNMTMALSGVVLFITVCAMPLVLIALTKKEKFVPVWGDVEEANPKRFIVVNDKVSLPTALKQLEVKR